MRYLLLLVFLLPSVSHAAIAFGGISAVSTSQTPTSVAVSGSNTLGLVYVVGDTADNITAATWGGSSMTKITAVQTPGDRYSSVWYIVNPSSSAAISFTGGSFWRSYSFYYTGVDQSSPIDVSNTATSVAANALGISLTVATANAWFVMAQKDTAGGGTYTPSNALASMRANTDAGGIAIADSNAVVSTGSQTGTLTSGGSSNHGGIAFSIKPVAAAVTTTSILGLVRSFFIF